MHAEILAACCDCSVLWTVLGSHMFFKLINNLAEHALAGKLHEDHQCYCEACAQQHHAMQVDKQQRRLAGKHRGSFARLLPQSTFARLHTVCQTGTVLQDVSAA